MSMKIYGNLKPVHRSFSLDAGLVALAKSLVPREHSDNLNRIINMALAELVEKYSRLKFEREIREMAEDLDLKKQSDKITMEFQVMESDGLL